jgi:hypothetical protein
MIPIDAFDKPLEYSHDFVQPDNIAMVKGSQGLCFSVLRPKSNHLL